MKANLMILGLVLVLGGCEGEGVDSSSPDAQGGPSRGTATVTNTNTNTQTTSNTVSNTQTSTVSATATQSVSNTNTSLQTGTGTHTTTATGVVITWTSIGHTNETQTLTSGNGDTVTFLATATVTSTATLTMPFVRPAQLGYNPCVDFRTGWNGAENKCYTTMWCEPSVASAGLNTQVGYPTQVSLRPASAKCAPGQTTYTYQPAEILIWGSGVEDSQYWGQGGNQGQADGYVCVPNKRAFTINC